MSGAPDALQEGRRLIERKSMIHFALPVEWTPRLVQSRQDGQLYTDEFSRFIQPIPKMLCNLLVLTLFGKCICFSTEELFFIKPESVITYVSRNQSIHKFCLCNKQGFWTPVTLPLACVSFGNRTQLPPWVCSFVANDFVQISDFLLTFR